MDTHRQNVEEDAVTEVSDCSDCTIWPACYGYEDEAECVEYEADGAEFHEEVEDERERLKATQLIDIFADLVLKISDKRAERIAAKAEATKQKLRQLIGAKKKTVGSEETLITPEDELDIGSEASSMASVRHCLKDIDISDSQLKLRNRYTTFPVPEDPGIIPAFWITRDNQEMYPGDGVDLFLHLTKEVKIQPIKALKNMLLSDTIGLQYYGINPRVVRPLCAALKANTTVEKINLTENWLSEDACYHLGELLQRNSVIHTLLLAGCRIGPKGAWRLQDGIADSPTLTTLDLSDCNIGTEGMEYVKSAVRNSHSLQHLSLNDNHLDESCVDYLQQLVVSSDTLERLELSWNSLYTAEVWKKFGKAIELNEILVDLDLSWNALGRECVNYLRILLSRSPPLKKLNLTGNRFYAEDAAIIAKGLSKNKVLEELYLGNNPLRAEGALELVRAVTPQISPESELRLLDLTNVWAEKNVLPELQAIEDNRPWLKVKLGGILSNYTIGEPNVPVLLFKRANFEAMRPKKKRQRRNFGHFVLSLEENPVSKQNFVKLVKSFKLKLSETLIQAIANAFAGPKNTVNIELLKSVYMNQYPDTELPPIMPKKKKGKRPEGSRLKKKKVVKIKGKNEK